MSRRIVVAPVNAPKKIVPVSSDTGAARTIVGVPTLPRNAITASCPRSSAVADTPGVPGRWASFVVGQRGGFCVACTFDQRARGLLGEVRLVLVVAEVEHERPAADPARRVLRVEGERDAELHVGAELLVRSGDRRAHSHVDRR